MQCAGLYSGGARAGPLFFCLLGWARLGNGQRNGKQSSDGGLCGTSGVSGKETVVSEFRGVFGTLNSQRPVMQPRFRNLRNANLENLRDGNDQ